MSQTLTDVIVTNGAWVDLNTATGIAVGTAMDILNKSLEGCILYEGTTSPSVSSKDGQVISGIEDYYAKASVLSGSLKVWARVPTNGRNTILAIQEV